MADEYHVIDRETHNQRYIDMMEELNVIEKEFLKDVELFPGLSEAYYSVARNVDGFKWICMYRLDKIDDLIKHLQSAKEYYGEK